METSRKFYAQRTHRRTFRRKKYTSNRTSFLPSFDSCNHEKEVNLEKLRKNSVQWAFIGHVTKCSDLKKEVDAQGGTANERLHCIRL